MDLLTWLRDNWHVTCGVGGSIWWMSAMYAKLRELVKEVARSNGERIAESGRVWGKIDSHGRQLNEHHTRITVLEKAP